MEHLTTSYNFQNLPLISNTPVLMSSLSTEITVYFQQEAVSLPICQGESFMSLNNKLCQIFPIPPKSELLLINKDSNQVVKDITELINGGKYQLWIKDLEEKVYSHLAIQQNVHTHDLSQRIQQQTDAGTEETYQFKCPYLNCRKTFKQSGNLKTHIRSHTGERPFTCEYEGCSMAFITKGHLKTHQFNHRQDKPFQCETCGRGYSQKSRLEIHIRKHFGIKPFECEDCGKKFTENGNLKVHKRSHNGERKFKCDFCPQRFITKGHLIDHVKRHINNRPFKCDDCGTQFYRSTQLKKHQYNKQVCLQRKQQKDSNYSGIRSVDEEKILSNFHSSSSDQQIVPQSQMNQLKSDQNLAIILGLQKNPEVSQGQQKNFENPLGQNAQNGGVLLSYQNQGYAQAPLQQTNQICQQNFQIQHFPQGSQHAQNYHQQQAYIYPVQNQQNTIIPQQSNVQSQQAQQHFIQPKTYPTTQISGNGSYINQQQAPTQIYQVNFHDVNRPQNQQIHVIHQQQQQPVPQQQQQQQQYTYKLANMPQQQQQQYINSNQYQQYTHYCPNQ